MTSLEPAATLPTWQTTLYKLNSCSVSYGINCATLFTRVQAERYSSVPLSYDIMLLVLEELNNDWPSILSISPMQKASVYYLSWTVSNRSPLRSSTHLSCSLGRLRDRLRTPWPAFKTVCCSCPIFPCTLEICWSRFSRLSPRLPHSKCSQSVAVGESASSAGLKRDNGSKTRRWNCNGISHQCKNILSSIFAHAISSYVCLKPDECAVEAAAEVPLLFLSEAKMPQFQTRTWSHLEHFGN